MKNLLPIFFLCPIPEEQKPIQQYIQWKRNSFSFSVFSFLFLKDLESQLLSSYLLYEESAWFDTQIWEKPLVIIQKDRLLYSQHSFFSTFFLF